MSIGISTDGTRERMLENEPEKLKQAVKEKSRELGLTGIEALKGQDALKQLKDMDEYGSLMAETILEEKEKREHATRERQRGNSVPDKVALKRFLEKRERRSRSDYEGRRLVLDEEFCRDVESCIRMLPLNVLLKEDICMSASVGVELLPGQCVGTRCYVVVGVGELVDEVSIGDNVVVSPNCGTEIRCFSGTYRIVCEHDILGVVDGR